MAAWQMVYARNDSFVYRDIAGETVLVPVYGEVADMESIYTLNEVGARIWNLIDGQRTLGEVGQALADEYDAPPADVEADLLEFVEALDEIDALRPLS